MAKIKDIPLTDLLVNPENYRFETLGSQKESIDKMIASQDEKLFNLAEHILTHGLNPNDNIQVIESNHEKNKFIVVEGNRRVVALKILTNPDLIDQHTSLKKKFKKFHDENKVRIPKEVTCAIYADPKEADVWIGIKHGFATKSGVATDGWDSIQKQRFVEKTEGKTSVALQTIKLLQNSSDVPDDIKNNLTRIKTTNLDRLFDDPDVREFLGIEINNGIIQSNVSEKEVIKGLTQVAKDLLKPGFNVKKIYTKQDRKDYIKAFPKVSIPDTNIKSTKPWQLNSSTSTTSSKAAKPKPNPKDRNRLIPRTCRLSINNSKLNAIYYELQKLDIEFTNSAAVLLRVFIELSLDCFIEANELTKVSKDSRLISKITEVANYLEHHKLADSHICKGIRSASSNKNDLLGIETLHAYVHNATFSPSSQNLIITWDNIQSFIEKVWENIK